MALIRDYRKKMNATGLLYVDDVGDRWAQIHGRQERVDHRTETLRTLAARIDPHLRIVTDRELQTGGYVEDLDPNLAQIIRKKGEGSKQQREYTVYQTGVIRACQKLLSKNPGTVTKAGWCLDWSYDMQEDRDVYTGGEETFDQSLPTEWNIGSYYVMPGFRMELQRNKKGDTLPAAGMAPYLLQKDHADRCRIPQNRDDISAELGRLKPGITAVGLGIVRAASAVLLREDQASAELNHLNTNCWGLRRETVRDERIIEDTRRKLEAALSTLLS
jgi:hypothetical protein